MTKDVIALTERMPDALSVLAGLLAGGPDLLVESAGEGAVVQLCDAEGRPLVSIEVPLMLQVPGEAARLLGPAPSRRATVRRGGSRPAPPRAYRRPSSSPEPSRPV